MKRDVDYVIAMLIACTRFSAMERMLYASKQENTVVIVADAILENCKTDYIDNLINEYLVENKQDYDEYLEYIKSVIKEEVDKPLNSIKSEVEAAFECGEITTIAYNNIMDKLNNLENIINK